MFEGVTTRPQATTTKQIVDTEKYRDLSEIVLEVMRGWAMIAKTDERVIIMDLRDAVFERAGKRLNK